MNKIIQYEAELLTAQQSIRLVEKTNNQSDLRILHERIAQLRKQIYDEIKVAVTSATRNLTGTNLYAIPNLVPDFKLLSSSEQKKMCFELGFVLEGMGNLQRGPKARIGFGSDGIAR
jgi:hypothetical protein